MDYRDLGERLESTEWLDRVADPIRQAVMSALPAGSVKDALHGTWLGHPLHPVLTDLPIGFWTSAWFLDLMGGKRMEPAADMLIALGVASAIPTAASGMADWSELFKEERRTGVVHAGANYLGTALYGLSLLARRRGKRRRGFVLAMAGSAVVTLGGYLGGHLSYRRAAGVNQIALEEGVSEWTAVLDETELADGRSVGAEADGTSLVLFRRGSTIHALAARCSHLGGPLAEGEIDDQLCVICPWHGSTFRLDDGKVVHGPATAPQPAYDVRLTDGKVEVRRRQPAY
jgi:nitrite reductase/ring-hydroxylating ferredoxin subunit/uncharacterized membrane protein